MQLTRVRIEALRRFRGVVTIDRLQPDLNLFIGPNGAGKSAIVRAIRAAFFERHRSAGVADLRPWDDPAAAPSVEVDFAIGAVRYRLAKRFLERPRCRLEITGGDGRVETLDGTAAEDRLAELLGFEHAGKGASRAEHWGVPGLLWIEQGEGQEVEGAVGNAAAHLRRALDASIDEVASTGGDDIVERVLAERARLLTPGRGQSTGELLAAERALADNARELAALREQRALYGERVERLAALREALAQDARERIWERVDAELVEARARLEETGRAAAAVAADRQWLDEARRGLALLEREQAEFDAQRRRRVAREQAQALAAEASATAQAALTAQQRRLDASLAALDAARAALALAERRQTRAELRQRIGELARERARLLAAEAAVAAAGERIEAARRAAAQSRVDDAAVERLRATERELQAARIRVEAVATEIRYRVEPGRSIVAAGSALTGEGTLRIAGETVLTIAGVGRLAIVPGGGEPAAYAAALANAQAAWESALQAAGVGSLAEAEARQRARRDALQAVRAEQATLDRLAPGGVAGFAAARAEVDGTLAAMQARLAALPADSAAAGADTAAVAIPAAAAGSAAATDVAATDVAATDPAAIAGAIAAARTTFDAAEARWLADRRSEEAARAAALAAQNDAAHAAAELAALVRELDSDDWQARVARNQQALAAARSRTDTLAQQVAAAERALALARPETLQQDVERLTRAATQARDAHRARREAAIALESQLDGVGADGLDERLAEAAAGAERLARRHAELDRRARALHRLAQLLQQRRAELTHRLQAPLRAHFDRYLALLLPGANVRLDDALAPAAIDQPGDADAAAGQGRFDQLSFGTREQIGLISRLAYADLLQAAGRPTLIIVDDGLVHTDAQRLAQMKRVLFDASRRHQILLFSCHPERWHDLGAQARDVASLTAARFDMFSTLESPSS
ncbi:MAG: AAA family ATPase [Lautropia sp.]